MSKNRQEIVGLIRNHELGQANIVISITWGSKTYKVLYIIESFKFQGI